MSSITNYNTYRIGPFKSASKLFKACAKFMKTSEDENVGVHGDITISNEFDIDNLADHWYATITLDNYSAITITFDR